MAKQAPKRYTEKHKDNLYLKDYFDIAGNGESYPKNRISIDLVEYSGEYQNRDGKIVSYEGEKVKISNYKLQSEDGQVVKKKKEQNGYIKDDVVVTHMTVEAFKDLGEYFQTLGEEK